MSITSRWGVAAISLLCVLAAGGCPRLIGAEEHRRKEAMAKHTTMAEIHWMAGNYEGAADEYRALIELAPRFPDAYQGLGNALNKLGRYEEAAASYRTAVELAPDNFDFRFNLGVTLARLGRYGEAAEEFERAAALKRGDAETYIYWGSALRESGDAEGAAAVLARALVLEPRNPLARVNLALTLERLDPARAIVEWKAILKMEGIEASYAELAREHLAALGGDAGPP